MLRSALELSLSAGDALSDDLRFEELASQGFWSSDTIGGDST